MCYKDLTSRTVDIVEKMFYRNTFDITLLDKYFEEKEVDVSLVFSLYGYIATHIGRDTFIFSDVFDTAFQKIVARFLLHYPTIHINSLRYQLDDTKENPVVFSNEFTQKMFNIWIKKER